MSGGLYELGIGKYGAGRWDDGRGMGELLG